jgi:hypothetical protein
MPELGPAMSGYLAVSRQKATYGSVRVSATRHGDRACVRIRNRSVIDADVAEDWLRIRTQPCAYCGDDR